MEIQLAVPAIVDGMSERQISIQDDPMPNGLSHALEIVVWVSHDDSRQKMGEEAKRVAIDFLERALEALRRG